MRILVLYTIYKRSISKFTDLVIVLTLKIKRFNYFQKYALNFFDFLILECLDFISFFQLIIMKLSMIVIIKPRFFMESLYSFIKLSFLLLHLQTVIRVPLYKKYKNLHSEQSNTPNSPQTHTPQTRE